MSHAGILAWIEHGGIYWNLSLQFTIDQSLLDYEKGAMDSKHKYLTSSCTYDCKEIVKFLVVLLREAQAIPASLPTTNTAYPARLDSTGS